MLKRKKQTVAEAVEAVLAGSEECATFRARRDRLDELHREKRALEGRIQELAATDLDGAEVRQTSAGHMVEDRPGHFIPVDSWRAERERERAAVAVLDGEEPEDSPRERALAEIAEAETRLQAVKDAIPIAERRVKEAENAAKAAVRDGIRDVQRRLIAEPLAELLPKLGDVAARQDELTDALNGAGLPPLVPGFTGLGSLSSRPQGSKLNLLLRQVQAGPDDG